MMYVALTYDHRLLDGRDATLLSHPFYLLFRRYLISINIFVSSIRRHEQQKMIIILSHSLVFVLFYFSSIVDRGCVSVYVKER